ncbi:MAG: ABC transporter substrate-binding protein [Alphaproteobacteria bacterium]|nr:ABC transporter substrate-binding protein [Alphaproteobacteria bacterium]
MRRRALLKGVGALAASAAVPMPAIAQTRTIRYTLSWLPTGGNAYVYMARQLGYWKKRGLEVELARGYGSMAAIQAVSQGKFDLGNSGSGAVLLSVIKGTGITIAATVGYDSGMGIIVPAAGPVAAAADLKGRTIGATANGSDTPFLPPYFKKLGLKPDDVTVAFVDSQIIEQSVIQGRTDGMVAVASSSIPVFVTHDVAIRFFPFSDQGLRLYGSSTIVSNAFLKQNRSLVADFTEGMLEGLRFSLLNPRETVERFLKEQEVIAMKKDAARFTEFGLGIGAAVTVAPEPETNGLGFTDLAALGEQATLVRAAQGSERDPDPPPAATYATNGLIGHVALSSDEWQQVRRYAAPYAAYLGRTL